MVLSSHLFYHNMVVSPLNLIVLSRERERERKRDVMYVCNGDAMCFNLREAYK
ncbi:hypothetical protein LguiB_010274 [Lonicera macranthoides]